MHDFWPGCGFALLERGDDGWLLPTDAYLRLLLARPELALVEESCAAERALHAALLEHPARPVPAAELLALRDADARTNYGHWLAFRDALLAAGTLEAWLLKLFRSASITLPPVFIDLVIQAIVRGLLDGITDAVQARAAELLFRPQRITLRQDRVLAGDRDSLDLQNETAGFGDLGRLLVQANAPLHPQQLQVLGKDNGAAYWADAAQAQPRYRFGLDLTHEIKRDLGHGIAFSLVNARSGLKALASVLERWVHHLLGVVVAIEPVQRIEDAQWRWHIGLDAQASKLLDDLYEGRDVDADRMRRLVSLFRLTFANPAEMRRDVAGKPVYLGLMMDTEQVLRLKPQNLLLNLPLAAGS